MSPFSLWHKQRLEKQVSLSKHPIKTVAKHGNYLLALDNHETLHGLHLDLALAFSWSHVSQISVEEGTLNLVKRGSSFSFDLKSFTVQPSNALTLSKKLVHPKLSNLSLVLHDDGAIRVYNHSEQLGHSHRIHGHWLTSPRPSAKWMDWDHAGSLRWVWTAALEDHHSRITLMRPKAEND